MEFFYLPLMLLTVAAIVVCTTVAISDWHPQQKNVTPKHHQEIAKQPLLPPSRNEQRKELFNKFLEGATRLAEISEDDEALQVVAYLQEHLILTELGSNGKMRMLSQKSQPLPFLVLFPEDERLAPQFSSIMQASALAWHKPILSLDSNVEHLVIIHPDALSHNMITCGLTLLHEGKHAYDWEYQPSLRSMDLASRCASERRAHELTERVLYKMNPQAYTSAVETLKTLILADDQSKSCTTPQELGMLHGSIPLHWTADMEKLLGSPRATHNGRTSEGSEIVTLSFFAAAKDLFPKYEDSDRKEKVMAGMLNRAGVLKLEN